MPFSTRTNIIRFGDDHGVTYLLGVLLGGLVKLGTVSVVELG